MKKSMSARQTSWIPEFMKHVFPRFGRPTGTRTIGHIALVLGSSSCRGGSSLFVAGASLCFFDEIATITNVTSLRDLVKGIKTALNKQTFVTNNEHNK